MMIYFWLILVVILGIIEALTVGLVTIWFVISGIVSMIVSIFIDNFLIQFAIFVVLGVLLLITTRKQLTKLLVHTEKTNLDMIVGSKGIVTEKIIPDYVGEVKVGGKRWSAISKEEIDVNRAVKVLNIDGVKLNVESWKE